MTQTKTVEENVYFQCVFFGMPKKLYNLTTCIENVDNIF